MSTPITVREIERLLGHSLDDAQMNREFALERGDPERAWLNRLARYSLIFERDDTLSLDQKLDD